MFTHLVGFDMHFIALSPSALDRAMDAGVVRQLHIRTLILSLFVIISEILRRFRVPVQVHIDFSVNYVEQLPDPPAPQRPRPAQRCEQGCRFCDQPCHRHKFDIPVISVTCIGIGERSISWGANTSILDGSGTMLMTLSFDGSSDQWDDSGT